MGNTRIQGTHGSGTHSHAYSYAHAAADVGSAINTAHCANRTPAIDAPTRTAPHAKDAASPRQGIS
jgi:hypothetical protein